MASLAIGRKKTEVRGEAPILTHVSRICNIYFKCTSTVPPNSSPTNIGASPVVNPLYMFRPITPLSPFVSAEIQIGSLPLACLYGAGSLGSGLGVPKGGGLVGAKRTRWWIGDHGQRMRWFVPVLWGGGGGGMTSGHAWATAGPTRQDSIALPLIVTSFLPPPVRGG